MATPTKTLETAHISEVIARTWTGGPLTVTRSSVIGDGFELAHTHADGWWRVKAGYAVAGASELAVALTWAEFAQAEFAIVKRFPHLARRAHDARWSMGDLRALWLEGLGAEAVQAASPAPASAPAQAEAA